MLIHEIEHAAHLLPSQGPLTVFVHHNPLHAFEDLPFDAGVRRGGEVYGCQPYLAEPRYRMKMAAGRIPAEDIEATLVEELGEAGAEQIAGLSSRLEIRLARLRSEIPDGAAREIRWIVAEADALRRFGDDVAGGSAAEIVRQAKEWAGHVTGAAKCGTEPSRRAVAELVETFDLSCRANWSPASWEAFALEALWALCRVNTERFTRTQGLEPPRIAVRPRDFLLEATGEDTDQLVNDVLVPFCGAFDDQGFAQWPLPGREEGFLQSFILTHGRLSVGTPRWRRSLPELLRPLAGQPGVALGSIAESLDALGVAPDQSGDFILQSLLALRGWSGMAWQLESNASWLPHPAPAGTLVELLCVRLILDRLAVAHVARKLASTDRSLSELRAIGPTRGSADRNGRLEPLAYETFRLAQRLGWSPDRLASLTDRDWDALLSEIEALPDVERRRVLHLSFERRYLRAALQAIESHASKAPVFPAAGRVPSFQIVCCLDEREESFRRAIEEIDPACETFGMAGFFGVAMYYRGASDAHFQPLCPVTMVPQHSVIEESAYSFRGSSQRLRTGQRRAGQLVHRMRLETRTLWGGLFAGLAGAVAAVPLVARILFPRSVAILRRLFGRLGSPPLTELRLDREAERPAEAPTAVGYTVDEMADVVQGALLSMGLTPAHGFSTVIVVCGHGSASLNNPQEAAHDCGACGGGRGGANARTFAQMANDPRVRRLLASRGVEIEDGVRFVGAYHNTCDDSVAWYDLDLLPRENRPAFEHVRNVIDVARGRNALERCRRFESAPLSLDEAGALRHVEARSEDLSQTRPEYGHATNVLCLVGRREWSRGLFLDRRAFLTSYDPRQDDPQGTILQRLLRSIVPVCAGINLEYYFSYVDPTGYGCGTKLPHNLACLLGVMDGARSDLRTGLPWQMVEIHEPVRLQFVIETTPEILRSVLDENPDIARLVDGSWVHMAVLDSAERVVHRYRDGAFERQAPPGPLPTVGSSAEWYRGRRDHLGFAAVSSGVS